MNIPPQNNGEHPQPLPWEAVHEQTAGLLDQAGRLDFAKLMPEQRTQLGAIVVYSQAGEQIQAPDITDPAAALLPQQPHHLLEDDMDFIRGKNNFHTGFRHKIHIYDPFRYMPYLHRFKIIAPELFGWLERVETEREQHAERTSENIEALRLAYLIASQLVCRDDPNLYHRHPDDTLAM